MKSLKALIRSTADVEKYNRWISNNAGGCSWEYANMSAGYCIIIRFDNDEDAVAFKLMFDVG